LELRGQPPGKNAANERSLVLKAYVIMHSSEDIKSSMPSLAFTVHIG
jgi:hypothetical protein